MNNFPPFIQKMLNNNQVLSNPMVQNAMTMFKNNNVSGLEELANNIARAKGTTVEAIRKQMGI